MTVRRHSDDYFEAAPSAVATAVRIVLSRRPPYIQTSETEKVTIFTTNVKPKWWLLGTDMTVHLQPSSGGTQVVAKTESQFFIMGDVFGFYNRYIRDFLKDLRIELQGQKA
jgi:hypothetical protein